MPVVSELLEQCADLPMETVEPGDVLIAEGSDPGRLLVMAHGSVTVERAGVPFARIDAPGAVFGEMSWILGRQATATVRATARTQVHVMADPAAFLAANPTAALAILRMTASRLDGLTRYLVDVKAQFAGREDHLGMVDGILDALVHHQAPVPRAGSVRDPEV